MFSLPRIYPITDTRISGLSHAEQVKQLLHGGATLIQLREKRGSMREFIVDAAEAVQIAHAAGAQVIINDRVDVARAVEADGVHLGQTDMPIGAARELLGNQAIIGLSTHNIVQAQNALNLPIDYLAFGPIYPTQTKTNPDRIVGLNQLGIIKSLSGSISLVAIGGINRTRIVETLTAGADSVAIISSLLAEPTRIAENFRSHVSLTKSV